MKKTFKRDLERGLQVQDMVAEILKKKYPCTTVIEGYFKDYDIWIPELHKSVEVKSDLKSQYTGNIVVEIEMFDKPSGLLATKADYWVFYDGEEFVYMTPKDIVNCILFNKLRYSQFVGKGDTAEKKAFLIKKHILFKYGKDLTDL